MFVTSTLIFFSARSGNVGIAICLFVGLVELTRSQGDTTPALWRTRCLEIFILGVGRYHTGHTLTFQPGVSCSKGHIIKIKKEEAKRKIGKMQGMSG
jgi:hypothetical protein